MSFRTGITIPSYVLAIVGGLLSDVIAGYLAPALAERAWVTVTLFLSCVLSGLLLLLYQERKTYIVNQRLLTWMKPETLQQLRAILRNVPEFDTVNGRRTFLQLAVPTPAALDLSTDDTTQSFLDSRLYDHIEFEGSKERFLGTLLSTLLQEQWFEEGKHYLQSLLTIIGDQSGGDVAEKVDALLPTIAALSLSPRRNATTTWTSWTRTLQLLSVTTTRLRWYLALVPLLLLLTLLFSPLVSTIWAQHAPVCPPDRTCILVAAFAPPEHDVAREITDAVEEEVRNVIAASGGKRFTVKRIAAVATDEAAREQARQQRALLIIWGNVKPAINQLTVDFELTDLLGASEASDVRAFRIEPQAYVGIDDPPIQCTGCLYTDIAKDVSQQARIIAYTAMGMLHYAQGWPEQARLDFAAALFCAGEVVDRDLIAVQQPVCQPATPNTVANPGLLYYYLGRSLQFRSDYARALAYLDRADRLNPADPAVQVGIGLVYQRWLNNPKAQQATDHFHTAITRVSQLIDNAPEPAKADLYFAQGTIYELLDEYDTAQNRYSAAITSYRLLTANKVAPASAYNAEVALGRIQRIRGDTSLAEQTLKNAISDEPDLPWAYLELARLYQDRPQLARDALNKAIGRSPTTAYVYLTEAELCTKWGLDDCVVQAYEKALTLRPGSGWIYDQIGTYWYRRHNYDEAGKKFSEALERHPCDPWLHERIAFVLGNTGQPASAAWHYTQAIQLLHEETSQTDRDRLQQGLQTALETAKGQITDSPLSTCKIRFTIEDR